MKNRVTEVTEDLAFNYPTVADIIRSRGYYVREGDGTNSLTIRIKTPQSFIGDRFPSPVIYLDDMRLRFFDFLYQFPTEDIESFYIDKTGAREGVQGAGGVIRLYTRRGGNPLRKDRQNNQQIAKVTVHGGFQRIKKFYTPNYRTYFDEAFEQFGVIHWEPELVTDEEGKVSFKILDTELKGLSFFIEGMSETGDLISVTKTISIN